MNSDQKLDDEILRAISKPLAYPEIEKIIGPQEGYALGIALSRMAASKQIHYKEPKSFAAEWPVYSRNPIPKTFQSPKRTDLAPNA